MIQKKQRAKISDIIAIPLNSKQFAFGRLLEDASIEIFIMTSQTSEMPDRLETSGVLMANGLFDDKIKSGEWPVVGRIPFKNPRHMWPPPKKIIDDLDAANYQIYYKGEIQKSSLKKVTNLEEQFMYKPQQLIDEIKRRLKKSAPKT